MSHFGDRVKKLRKEKGLTLEQVAKKISSHKGYVSGIENDKVNPPSVKVIKKFAKLFRLDARELVRLAWVDKAPEILREDAEEFLTWAQGKDAAPLMKVPSAVEPSTVSMSPESAPVE